MKLASPESLPDFQRLFPDEARCADYLFALRWADGYVCEECGSKVHSISYERQRIQCNNGHQVYITAGTIIHRAHTDLLTWFYGAFLVTTLTPGISAVQFQRQLGLKRYETAFQILHKLRAAMVNPNREKLRGVVEVDETYIGGTLPGGKGGRSTEHKTLVVGAVEQRHSPTRKRRGGVCAGRIRLCAIETASRKELTEFVEDHVAKASTILTDGWEGYSLLAQRGYEHLPTVEGHRQNTSHILPLIHIEFANLKTWLQGTHHGRQERQHLHAYLNEFAFRHNRRFWRFSAFQTVLRLGMKQRPQEYSDLYNTDEYGRGVHIKG
jgi:hypothetical protein